ncbi:hypothetical protein AB834_03675 [PVC group bacterium (ex Bugula neritina AB1)]|nr:hypothetical protein AB834_03675 [PVC group bacterium (ex Bugula neritina AB1)]
MVTNVNNFSQKFKSKQVFFSIEISCNYNTEFISKNMTNVNTILFIKNSITSFKKLSLVKSHHVFKKSKEKFVMVEPHKILYVSPYFSNQSDLFKFIGDVVIFYFFKLSYSSKLKFKLKCSKFNLNFN